MAYQREHINVICGKLLGQSRQTVEEIGDVFFVPCGYKTDNTPPADGWQPFDSRVPFFGKDDIHYWFKASFKTPAVDEHHQLFFTQTTGREGQWDAINPQGLLYLNGKMVQGLDTNHTEAYLEPDTDYDMLDYVYILSGKDQVYIRLSLISVDTRIEKLYYDLKVPLDAACLPTVSEPTRSRVLNVLEQAVSLLDLRQPFSEEYFASIAACEAFLEEEYYNKLCSTEGKPVVNCIGHTHIDVEWQWSCFQTAEKMQRSFSTAKSLMDHYPEYKFMLSQPQLYQYLEKEAPEKYEELKQLVKDGRWEPEGAMYLEADCNLISGESFVRQILQGKKYFREAFGVESHILFLPDVFGYSAALPQILMKSGVRHFVTSKISWNDTNTMPVDTFLWRGLDGTEIFTNFITTCEDSVSAPRETTYVGKITPSQTAGCWHRFQQKPYSDRVVNTFGFGDGGGGPTRDMLEQQRRLAKGLPEVPVTEIGLLLPHLDEVRRQFDEECARSGKTPRWVGELYLEYHRGTYTSIGKNKRNNRRSEFMLQKAETLSAIDLLHGGSYDAPGLYECWRKVLHNQFHDIIPGSSIHEVYELTDGDYAEVLSYGQRTVDEKIEAIAGRLHTDGGMLVYNPLGFARKGTVQVDGVTVETKQPIPAFGWTVIKDLPSVCGVTLDGNTAENSRYILTVDDQGRIARLYDKQNRQEVLSAPGNDIQIFEDYPFNYDNWEISEYYKQKMWHMEEATVTPVTDGTRAGFRIVRPYRNSAFTQHIWLYTDSPRIDIETVADWHEDHQLVKAAFPLNIKTNCATYEIQYGHVTRPTHQNTSWEQAKFEVYGHKWVDVSDHGYGVALLNDCKYGHNIEDNVLKITLLKCGTFPDTAADQGEHRFTYSLLPHDGHLCEAGVIEEAYGLNQPLEFRPIPSADGSLPETYSPVTVDVVGIIPETMKKAEADDGLILRLYEAYDRCAQATITLPSEIRHAYRCDLMENVEEELLISSHTVTLPFSNYEIHTLKLTK